MDQNLFPPAVLARIRQGSIKQDTRQYVSRLQHWGDSYTAVEASCSAVAAPCCCPSSVSLSVFSDMAIRRPLEYIRRSKTIQHVAARRDGGQGHEARVRLDVSARHGMSPRRLALGSSRRPWALTPVLPSHSHLPECRLPRRRSFRLASPRRSQARRDHVNPTR